MVADAMIRQAVFRIALAVILAGGALSLSGCDAGPRHDTAHLAGLVTIDATPVSEGKMVFLPSEAAHGPAVGVEIKEGLYDCPEAPTGKVIAQVYAVRDTGKKLQVMGKEIPELLNIVPTHARVGIEIVVQGDNLHQDFTLVNKR